MSARKSAMREILEWAVTLALAAALALAVHTWVGGIITISGQSMEPGIQDNQKIVTGKLEYYFSRPKRGDIVIIRYPDRADNIIKRVIATAGEEVRISGGSVYIDDIKLSEPYLLEPIRADFEEQTVPEDTIFVMGDNRNHSNDSRIVGPVPLSQVLGRAYCIIWPLGDMKKLTVYTGKLKQ